ncbi:hypothetical protein P3T43_000622 [Paraburkholderia sp. GAS41]|jgi:hypothetical protein
MASLATVASAFESYKAITYMPILKSAACCNDTTNRIDIATWQKIP